MVDVKGIFVIIPEDDHTDVALYANEFELFSGSVVHPAEDLGNYETVLDQCAYRMKAIQADLKASGIELYGLKAAVAPCPDSIHMTGEICVVTEDVIRTIHANRAADLPACEVGGLLANVFARGCQSKGYLVKPGKTIEEMADLTLKALRGQIEV